MILAGLIMLVASGCGSRREAARKSVDLAQNEEFERRKSGETQVNSPTEITPELGCGGRRVTVAPDQVAPEEIRDWMVGEYVVRYLIADARIVVLRVWHGKEQRT